MSKTKREDFSKAVDQEIAIIVNRKEGREKELIKIKNTLKTAKVEETTTSDKSPEEFFQQKAKTEARDQVADALETKIDNEQMTMAEIDDKDIANEIALKTITEAGSPDRNARDLSQKPFLLRLRPESSLSSLFQRTPRFECGQSHQHWMCEGLPQVP